MIFCLKIVISVIATVKIWREKKTNENFTENQQEKKKRNNLKYRLRMSQKSKMCETRTHRSKTCTLRCSVRNVWARIFLNLFSFPFRYIPIVFFLSNIHKFLIWYFSSIRFFLAWRKNRSPFRFTSFVSCKYSCILFNWAKHTFSVHNSQIKRNKTHCEIKSIFILNSSPHEQIVINGGRHFTSNVFFFLAYFPLLKTILRMQSLYQRKSYFQTVNFSSEVLKFISIKWKLKIMSFVA